MASLLIRDIDEDMKRRLAVRAAEHGRSQQAEARAILQDALSPDRASWLDMLLTDASKVGGIDIPIIERHAPRITGIAL